MCNFFLALQLGGKNAAIVFEDADLDKSVSTCIRCVEQVRIYFYLNHNPSYKVKTLESDSSNGR